MGRVIYVSPAAYPRPRHDRKRDRLVNRRRVIMQMEEQPGCDEGKGEKEKKKEKKTVSSGIGKAHRASFRFTIDG